jgi:acetyl-CoA C-acetyltransferase
MVMMTREKAAALGKRPLASIVSYSFVGVEPADFPDGPAVGIPVALEKADLTTEDITWFEVNEAFAVVVAITEKLVGIDHSRMNPHGGGISLGHPTGYTGARLAVHLSNILKRGELGVASACGGGGLAGTLIVRGEQE